MVAEERDGSRHTFATPDRIVVASGRAERFDALAGQFTPL